MPHGPHQDDRPLALVHARLLRPHPTEIGRVETVEDGSVIVDQGRILAVGQPPPDGSRVIDVAGRLVTPGLVDAHTHALFLGDRAAEFCARAAGTSYLELARQGGGIRATVMPTRESPSKLRRERARIRLRRLATCGVTSAEVKTGYGLSIPHERDQLEELNAIATADLPRVFPTLLAAHAIPPEVQTDAERDRYVEAIATELIPDMARRRRAGRVDVFVEETAYTHDEARRLAGVAKENGLAVHLHVDQLTASKGAQLAAEIGAQAAAHLERTDAEGVRALAGSGTVAILLPTATMVAGDAQWPPARALVDAGVPIALSTNLNPGTGPSESVSLTFFLAAVGLHLTAEEILWAMTRGGALALGEAQLGLIAPGSPADLVVWNAFELAHLPYHAGVNHTRLVIREGRVLVDRGAVSTWECDGVL